MLPLHSACASYVEVKWSNRSLNTLEATTCYSEGEQCTWKVHQADSRNGVTVARDFAALVMRARNVF